MRQIAKALNMTGTFLTQLKERFFDGTIIDVRSANGLTMNGIDLIPVIWSYIIKNTIQKVVKIQKAISLPYAPFVMMRFTARNENEQQGRTRRCTLTARGAGLLVFNNFGVYGTCCKCPFPSGK